MLKLEIKIKQCSPFLRTMSGTITVKYHQDNGLHLPATELFTCNFDKKEGNTGFNCKTGIPAPLFNTIRPIIDSKLRSYWHGMILAPLDWEWVLTEGEEAWSSAGDIKEETLKFLKIRDGEDP